MIHPTNGERGEKNATSLSELFKTWRSKEWREQFCSIEPKLCKLTYNDIQDHLIWWYGRE